MLVTDRFAGPRVDHQPTCHFDSKHQRLEEVTDFTVTPGLLPPGNGGRHTHTHTQTRADPQFDHLSRLHVFVRLLTALLGR